MKHALSACAVVLVAIGLFFVNGESARAQQIGTTAIVTDVGIPISDMKIYRIRATFNGGNCQTPPGFHPTHYVCRAGFAIPVTPGKNIQIIGGFPNNVSGPGAISTIMSHMTFTTSGITVGLTRDWTRFAGGGFSEAQWMDAAFAYEVDFIVLAVIN